MEYTNSPTIKISSPTISLVVFCGFIFASGRGVRLIIILPSSKVNKAWNKNIQFKTKPKITPHKNISGRWQRKYMSVKNGMLRETLWKKGMSDEAN